MILKKILLADIRQGDCLYSKYAKSYDKLTFLTYVCLSGGKQC